MLRRTIAAFFTLVVFLPAISMAQGVLENPQSDSTQSGIGIVSGWICEANQVLIEFDGTAVLEAAYGTSREDTRSVCGDADNGFALLVNWNLLGDGSHMIRLLADGEEMARAMFQVVTFGVEFLRGASRSVTVQDFPQIGSNTTLRWNESSQSFVVTSVQTATEIPSQFCPSVFYENNRVAFVTRVIDGDTVELEGGERIRYIGIDTPEEGELGFEEATQRNAELVEEKTITLDICEEEPKDIFGRTLAYVIVGSSVVNEVLLSEGLAVPLHIPPCGTETVECYQDIAQDTKECDPSYPTVCIPPPPPDLDCGDIPYRNFTVLSPDPHRFDRDGDGIGCEQ